MSTLPDIVQAHTDITGHVKPHLVSTVATACLIAVEIPRLPRQGSYLLNAFYPFGTKKAFALCFVLFLNTHSFFLENFRDKEKVWSRLVQGLESSMHLYSQLHIQ